MDARPAAITPHDVHVRGHEEEPVSVANPRRITWSGVAKMATGAAAEAQPGY